MDIVLWIVQGLLALAFLMAGFMKTFMPISTLQKRMTWVSTVAAPFVRFIGVAELLGAIGLILPEATGILPRLTVVAAVGLVIVMLSAAVFNALRREYSGVGVNVALLLLAALVVIGRLTFAPLG